MSDFISITNKNIKFIYLFLVVPIIMFQVFFTPPFQTPDSPNNFDRAYQVSNGLLIGRKLNSVSGGYLNNNIISTESVFGYIPFHYNHKITSNVLSKADLYRWNNNGKRQYTFSSFPNTSVYPPFAYLPQACAIGIGRLLDLSILHTYRLALLFVSLCAIFITYKALSLNSRITPAIFAAASLPMVTCLYAAMEADALLISIGFLLAAFMASKISDNEYHSSNIIYVSLMILFLALQKPPYIGLILLLFAPGLIVSNSYGFMKRLGFSIAITAIVAEWIVYAKSTAWINIDPSHKSLLLHLVYIITHPVTFITIFLRTIDSQSLIYYHQLVGVLGWLDAPLPGKYYLIAAAAFFVAAALSSAKLKLTDWMFLLLSVSSSAIMVFIALYADWSPVKSTIIQGVQGRYFLPLLPLSFMLLYPAIHSFYYINKRNGFLGLASIKSPIYSAIFASVRVALYSFLYFLFPLITFVYTAGVIIDRYYLIQTQAPSVTIKTSNIGQQPIPIPQGESVNIILRAPSAPYGASQLKGIDVLMATYSGTANGIVTLRACNSDKCAHSTLSVDNQKDNSYFNFLLNRKLAVHAGDNINIRITHVNGSNPVAIWLWRRIGSFIEQLSVGNKNIKNMSPRITLTY
jgi:uncharacterized membrane protein